jgi:hypothetical protein
MQNVLQYRTYVQHNSVVCDYARGVMDPERFQIFPAVLDTNISDNGVPLPRPKFLIGP